MKKLQKFAGLFALLVVALLTGCSSMPAKFPLIAEQPQVAPEVLAQLRRPLKQFNVALLPPDYRDLSPSVYDSLKKRGVMKLHVLPLPPEDKPSAEQIAHTNTLKAALSANLVKSGYAVVPSCDGIQQCLGLKVVTALRESTDETKQTARYLGVAVRIFFGDAEVADSNDGLIFKAIEGAQTPFETREQWVAVVERRLENAIQTNIGVFQRSISDVWEDLYAGHSTSDH